MYSQDSANPHPVFYYPSQQSNKQLLVAFWLLAIALLIYILVFCPTKDFSLNLVAALIAICALVPSYLWCAGRAQGIPVFPLFAISFIWTYALPLVTPNPGVEEYTIPDRMYAGLTASGFVALGTVIWFQFVKSAPAIPPTYRALDDKRGNQFFFICLFTSVLFNVALMAGWIPVEANWFSILRNVVIALTALSAFVLAYRFGKEELSKRQATLLVTLLVSYAVSQAAGLLLIGAATTSAGAIAAFMIGRKRIPVLALVILLSCMSFLHAGKAEMRAKYMGENQQVSNLQVWEYPGYYAEWADYASKSFLKPKGTPETEDKQSLLERSSVIQMLLLTQTKSPEPVPFLYGNTYEILPELIVPRIFNAQKLTSHEGTFRLNVHYGRQTYEEATKAVIAWGLLAEAYANFGLPGCAGLAIILGVLYGKAGRWSINAPILSIQSLFAVLMMTFALQAEWTAGVFVAAFFQYCFVLCGIVIILMRRYPSHWASGLPYSEY